MGGVDHTLKKPLLLSKWQDADHSHPNSRAVGVLSRLHERQASPEPSKGSGVGGRGLRLRDQPGVEGSGLGAGLKAKSERRSDLMLSRSWREGARKKKRMLMEREDQKLIQNIFFID